MKKRNVLLTGLLTVAGATAFSNKNLLKGIYQLEKPQALLWTNVDLDGQVGYLTKDSMKSEALFFEWILDNGWSRADQVGDGFFWVNDEQMTLLLHRENLCGGRYHLWRASRLIEQ